MRRSSIGLQSVPMFPAENQPACHLWSAQMNVLLELIEAKRTGSPNQVVKLLDSLPLEGKSFDERLANLCNRLGCRCWLDGEHLFVGFWPDLLDQSIRSAIEEAPNRRVCSLAEEGVPADLKHRTVPLRNLGESLSEWLLRTEQYACEMDLGGSTARWSTNP
jgi:hypothetical protein